MPEVDNYMGPGYASQQFAFSCTTAPANSQTVMVIDSTYGLHLGSQASMNSSTGTYLTPGPYRNMWPRVTVKYTVLATGQNVTAVDQEITGNAGTSADWETVASGSHAVTAGTTLPVTFTPSSGNWRIKIDAGATGPTTLTVHVTVTRPA